MAPIRFSSNQSAHLRFYVGKLSSFGLGFILFLSLTSLFAKATSTTPFLGVVHAAIPVCTNSVAGGVYLVANADGRREPDENYLSGVIQIRNSIDLPTETIESPNGLFVLHELPCDAYTVYHNGDYVGKLLVGEVMGQVLVELPKTNLAQHLFMPIITN